MTQQERLDYLVEAFKADSEEYKALQVPSDNDGKQRMDRVIFNVFKDEDREIYEQLLS